MNGIRVKDICKKFGQFTAVENISFTVTEGELVALLGPSGSGKSTLMRIIAGLETPDRGQIYIDGRDISRQATQRRNIGFVFQHYALFKHMTVEKNISFGLEIKKKDKHYIKTKVEELIHLVNLSGYENHLPGELSGGQRQRVALARALAPEPRILLLDEPFGSLDARIRENLAHWIQGLHKKINLTSIFVTHDQNEAMKIADKLMVINRGIIEQIGTTREIYEHPVSKFVASFIGNTNVICGVVQDSMLLLDDESVPIDQEFLQVTSGQFVVVMVRPEDVLVSRTKTRKCMIRSSVKEIFYRGSRYEILVNLGKATIKAHRDSKSMDRNGFGKDHPVYLGFDKHKIYRAPEGERRIREKLSQLGYIE